MKPLLDSEVKAADALNALAKLARETAARPTASELDRGSKLLFARVAAHNLRSARLTRWSLVGVGAILVCIVCARLSLAWFGHSPQTRPLTYRVEGGRVLEGGYLRDSGNQGVRLLFDEGSKVILEPGARGRLRSLDKEGSRVVIDQGTALIEVARSKERRWWVEAGPFSVAVKGTLFTVSWDPASERFELRLKHGSVLVSGPIASSDVELRAGQRLVVNLRKAETLISEEQPEPQPAASAPEATVAPAPEATAALAPEATAAPPEKLAQAVVAAATSTSSAAHRAEHKRSWAEQIASGQWDSVLAEVDRSGVEATLEQASSADLFALADAARYRRRTDLARAALLAQRRRFAGSQRSLDATFLLGRVEETHDRNRALRWYEEYLERAPTGSYAAEAMGRRLVLSSELKGCSAARPLIEQYLSHFPKGSYAETARALCRER